LHASIAPKQVGWVNGRLFLINASLGLYAALQEERESWKRQFGRSRLTAMVSGLYSLLTEPRKLTLEIESDGEHEVVSTPALFVANNRLQMGRVGLDPAALDGLDHGYLAALVARPVRSSQLFAMAFRGALGRLREDDNLRSFAFKRLTVRPRRDRYIKVATDGEITVMRTPLQFSVGAQPLKVLIPAPDERVALE
jgi:diacylglycerol kinase family enzyme